MDSSPRSARLATGDQNNESPGPSQLYEINVGIIQYARLSLPSFFTMTLGGTEIKLQRLNDQVLARVYEAFQQSISQRIGCRALLVEPFLFLFSFF
ncbi:MAG: hypothetical protein DMF75_09950 [Acidobacteria bacterium]|nr:MAG: hypothetical protein DMF75_09950 [Acidobacteriota bacterium]